MTWAEIAAKEGLIYCQSNDTWCTFVNMKDGTCKLDKCVNEKDGEVNGRTQNVCQNNN